MSSCCKQNERLTTDLTRKPKKSGTAHHLKCIHLYRELDYPLIDTNTKASTNQEYTKIKYSETLPNAKVEIRYINI